MALEDLIKGARYGRCLVLGEADPHITPSGGVHPKVHCLCDCGSEFTAIGYSLRTGSTKSCGCLARETTRRVSTTHGESNTYLYTCWEGMKRRAKDRGVSCGVHPAWSESYTEFRDWSVANGYNDSLHLCRNGDKGDYEPNNVRWATHAENVEEANARYWEVVDPQGNTIPVYNLNKFCKKMGLHSGAMCWVSQGKQKTHKGYTVKEVL